MRAGRCICFLAAVLFPFGAATIEIATGKMLRRDYDARSLSVRETGGTWQTTHTGEAFRPQAAGT